MKERQVQKEGELWEKKQDSRNGQGSWNEQAFCKGQDFPKEQAAGKKQEICWEDLPEQERMKYEIAEELGLLEQVRENGWKSLSDKETGRIGGLMTRRKREKKTSRTGARD